MLHIRVVEIRTEELAQIGELEAPAEIWARYDELLALLAEQIATLRDALLEDDREAAREALLENSRLNAEADLMEQEFVRGMWNGAGTGRSQRAPAATERLEPEPEPESET
jgi:hypothetical protein